jgi:hypothetical protein
VSEISIGLNAVIVAVTESRPRILTVSREGAPPESGRIAALPFGPLDAERDRTLELGLRDWVRQQTGLSLGYVEQLYTFADRDRDPHERRGAPRVVSVAYLALVSEAESTAGEGALWRDVYRFLPWEDWREGEPEPIGAIETALRAWERQANSIGERSARGERIDLTFGLGAAGWDAYRVLDRYELLYEAALVGEALRDGRRPAVAGAPIFGEAMALDHRRILATAMSRVRGKLKYRPVVFELVPDVFTLYQLQLVVEALTGTALHKQNFRRLVEKGGMVEDTGDVESRTGGRPAKLFRFRRDVLRERLRPGVGVPSPKRSASA